MRQRDTISLLIHQGWPGSACDKTQVINIFESAVTWPLCCYSSFALCWYLGQFLPTPTHAQNDKGGRRPRGIVRRLEAQRSCIVQSQNLDLRSWEVEGISVPGGKGGWGWGDGGRLRYFIAPFSFCLDFIFFSCIVSKDTVPLWTLSSLHVSPWSLFKWQKNQSVNPHACFRMSGLA